MLYDPNWKKPEVEVELQPWQKMLQDAANLIDKHGWTKGSLGSEIAGFCIVGALQRTAFGQTYSSYPKSVTLRYHQNYPVYEQAVDALIAVTHDNNTAVVPEAAILGFNDRIAERKEQILSKFREAMEVR